MLSYRHAYHAGNHGDVLKHAVLALLLQALTRKETPLCYLETHAGTGRYRLDSETARKTGEYTQGIGRLWAATEMPDGIKPYLHAVRTLNPDGALLNYPGSPELARLLLRPHDRIVLAELHSTDYPQLKANYRADRRIAVHHMDGYQALRAFLPPQENRGLVLIDPSFEVKSEYEQAVDALLEAQKRWRNGVFALWYPVIERATVTSMEQRLLAAGVPKLTTAELCIADDALSGMTGSGLFIVNTPWQLDQSLQALLPWLQRLLAGTDGSWRVQSGAA